MKILKIYDDLIRLHELGLDSEFQKNLGPEWQVEYYKITGWTRVKQVYPVEAETDGTDINIEEDDVFLFWNYHWDQHQEELQEKIKQKYRDLINKGARIKIQLYSSNGKPEEHERNLKHYIEFFGKDFVIDIVESPMHIDYMVKDFAIMHAETIKSFYI